ncbi:MAG TPA: ethylbenzene dehydrogenase-related protein [Pseudolabrys sp.]|nr:ethylbenzene dehydrogenase-related protein [Pseudolabrys sp.]
MAMPASRGRRSDYGTVLLHGCLVIALVVAILTGLRIAAESPGRTWINIFDLVLPRHFVWVTHMQVGVILIAVALAYAIYILLARLFGRIRLDRVCLAGLFGPHHACWRAINIVIYWLLYLTLLTELVTGVLLYLDFSNYIVIALHWSGLWLICACVIGHILAQWKLGAIPQLLRILRPMRLPPQPPAFDPIDLLDLLERNSARPGMPYTQSAMQDLKNRARAQSQTEPPPARAQATALHASNRSRRGAIDERPRSIRSKGPTLQSNPFMTASAATIVAVSLLLAGERETSQTLRILRVDASDVPKLDGDTSDPAWRMTKPVFVATGHGDNFDGKGETTVEIRAVHDGYNAYFLFSWDDPTRSLKQLPLLKTSDGWKLLHHGYESGKEHAYNEDKFAVLLTTSDSVLAGDRTFHASAQPSAGKPGTLSGHGLHYTDRPGVFVDVWEWKATSTNAAGFMDDDHFGPPAEATAEQTEGRLPYRGGFAADPGTASYSDNFEHDEPAAYSKVINPRRLPKNAGDMSALGKIDLDPDHGESDEARWFMTEEESMPFSRALNAKVPVGTVVPGVIVSGSYTGDRADVRCAARWAAGRWALEVTRKLDTGSPYDIPIATGTFMRVAAFDHSQINHTRHVRPIRLELEP